MESPEIWSWSTDVVVPDGFDSDAILASLSDIHNSSNELQKNKKYVETQLVKSQIFETSCTETSCTETSCTETSCTETSCTETSCIKTSYKFTASPEMIRTWFLLGMNTMTLNNIYRVFLGLKPPMELKNKALSGSILNKCKYENGNTLEQRKNALQKFGIHWNIEVWKQQCFDWPQCFVKRAMTWKNQLESCQNDYCKMALKENMLASMAEEFETIGNEYKGLRKEFVLLCYFSSNIIVADLKIFCRMHLTKQLKHTENHREKVEQKKKTVSRKRKRSLEKPSIAPFNFDNDVEREEVLGKMFSGKGSNVEAGGNDNHWLSNEFSTTIELSNIETMVRDKWETSPNKSSMNSHKTDICKEKTSNILKATVYTENDEKNQKEKDGKENNEKEKDEKDDEEKDEKDKAKGDAKVQEGMKNDVMRRSSSRWSQQDYALAWALQWLPSYMMLSRAQRVSFNTSKRYAATTISRFWHCVFCARRWSKVHPYWSRRTIITFLWGRGFRLFVRRDERIAYKVNLEVEMMLLKRKCKWRRWLQFRYMLVWVMYPDTSMEEFERNITNEWLPKIRNIVEKKTKRAVCTESATRARHGPKNEPENAKRHGR